MKILLHENLTDFDRAMRLTIGVTMAISLLFVPLEGVWIAALASAAMYPLLSGLTAIDPLFAIAENIPALKPVEISRVNSSGVL